MCGQVDAGGGQLGCTALWLLVRWADRLKGTAPHALATLLRHLHDLTPGPHPGPTLRFGGNSADNSAWLDHPDAPLPTGCNYGITQRDLSAYVNFASRTAAAANVSLIIDTNFGTSTDPRKLALPHIKAVVGHPGLMQHVSAVEIGNEMDVR